MIQRLLSLPGSVRVAVLSGAIFLAADGGRLFAGPVGEYAFRAETAIDKVQETVGNVLSRLNKGSLGGERSFDGLGIESYRNQSYRRDSQRRQNSSQSDARSVEQKSVKQSAAKTGNSRLSGNSKNQLASVVGKPGKNSVSDKTSGGRKSSPSSVKNERNDETFGRNGSRKSNSTKGKSDNNSRGLDSIFDKLGKNSKKGNDGDRDTTTVSASKSKKTSTSGSKSTGGSIPKLTSPVANSVPAAPRQNALAAIANVAKQVTSNSKPIESFSNGAKSESKGSSYASTGSKNGPQNTSFGSGGLFPFDLGEVNIKTTNLNSLFGNHNWSQDHDWGSNDPFCTGSSKCWKDCGILCDILKCDGKLFDKWLCKPVKWWDICDIIKFPCNDYRGDKDWCWFDPCWWKTWFDCHPNGCHWFCCHHHHDCDPDPPPSVPEPGSMTLAGMALVLGAGVGFSRRRRRRENSAETSDVDGGTPVEG